MDSPFETAPAAPGIPITFATKATWAGISEGLAGQSGRTEAGRNEDERI